MDINQPTDEEMLARVLHRDGLMLVIDKPAGIPVHKGPKGGPNLEASFDALRFGLPRPPVLAHRLDKETSGCLVLGRHRKATASLGLLFKHGKISKTYWAIVEGGPEADEGVIELPLGKLNAERGWWQKPDPNGQPAVTRWRVLGRSYSPASASPHSPLSCGTDSPPPCGEGSGVGVPTGSVARSHPPSHPSPTRGEGARPAVGEIEPPSTENPRLTWLAMEPITGRTHQLRVHSAASGWPIVGDNIYGNGPRFGEPRLHLHAREISIPLSKNKPPVHVVAPAPLHMHERLRLCGWNGE
ncbi:putative RNA pseudouridine synthase (Uracil hydrolyase) [Bradyrhizobium sp. ORS 375]|uniref:RluA family pseudouridine synthase n=1 Tax=Bradyrhizobium sp. (strain ORS 375) TaxID=566679 RepID=UPI0002405F90|nr:RNA pseudouridine synthase [Bradyrhizobium sp. ORS 375]CCD97092.1 putative RNA pseudouridine synthase (Uracil hydrolyase) [Bradyrhizobium sp. ORS 375]